MNAQLNFDLNDTDDKYKYKICNNAEDLAFSLWDFSQELRSILKHKDLDEKTYDQIEELQDIFYNILDGYDVNLDYLIH